MKTILPSASSRQTPSEAVSWGKVDPDKLGESVVVYADSTIAVPLMTAYALARVKPRRAKRLYERRDAIVDRLRVDYLAEQEKKARLKT